MLTLLRNSSSISASVGSEEFLAGCGISGWVVGTVGTAGSGFSEVAIAAGFELTISLLFSAVTSSVFSSVAISCFF